MAERGSTRGRVPANQGHDQSPRSWTTTVTTIATIIGAVAAVVALVPALRHYLVPPEPAWSAIAGPSCARSDTAQFDADAPADATLDGFTEVAGVGWNSDGCSAGAVTTKATVTRPDGQAEDTATWYFVPPSTVTSCRLSIYVPNVEDTLGVANLWIAGARSDDTYADRQWGADIELDRSKGNWLSLGPDRSFTPFREAVVLQFVDASYERPTLRPDLLALSAARITCD